MDPDLNKYDLEHVVTAHPKMTREDGRRSIGKPGRSITRREHIETLLRRAVVTDVPIMSLVKVLIQFTTMMQLEKVHPLQSGLLRLQASDASGGPASREKTGCCSISRHLRDLFVRNALFVRTAWWVLSVKRRIEARPGPASTTWTRRSPPCRTTRTRRSIT